ncbi:hypothetical protein BSKO_10106 [Bryopsis sp. KO-2023]|nr:hypothetical protein BSKO_10106 [Bryopsis sp. KO-2023]
MEAARQCNQSLVRINMSSRVGPDDLLARTSLKVNGLGKQEICFELQPFADAFQKGLWVLLDELNLAEEKTLQCIEHALDTGRLIIRDNSSALEPVRVLERHDNFRLFGTENPSAGLFRAMREKLSESFLSRFSLMVFKELPESEWVDIVIHRLSQGYLVDGEKPQKEEIGSLAKQMVEFHVKIVEGMREQSFAEKGAYATITIRELLMWCDLLCNREGQNAMDLAWLVYGSRFRHKGGEVVRKELIKAGFYEPTSSPQSSIILEVFSRDRKSSDGWWILNEAAWGERMGHASCPDDPRILKQCETVHREIGLLVMSPDFILKHGLQIDFSDMWLWEWIKAGASQSLLLPALADRLGAIGASLYASKFRHEEARKRIIQIFEQAFVFAEEPAVKDGALSAAPLILGERFLKALNLILLAVKSGNPVLVEGKSGCGKSALVKALAFIIGRDIEQIVLTPESEPSALLGQRLPCSSNSKQAEIQWVNGPLTRAYTNGCFLLVDNLGQAEAAVLERLNSTLEAPPMLCLSEKGDGGPLECRLMGDGSLREGPAEGFSFLATFTPPGKNSSGCDMLSNELSPALANRFSIIHVDDPMDKNDELFREEIKGMAGILMDCPGEAAQERVAALCWNIHQKLLPERNQLASLTMRSYIQMVDSAYLLQKRMHGQGSLDKALKAAFDLTFGVQLKDQRLRENVEKVVDESLDMPDSPGEDLRFLEELIPPSDLVLTDSRKEHAAAILACVAANRPVLLEGPPAVGKTALVTGLRRGLPVQGSKVEILNNSDTTTVQDYFGTWLPVNGKFTFCKGILVKAMKEGSWFLADELNLAPLPVISALAPVLEGCTSIDIPGASMCVQVHPDFRFFATQNDHRTAGRNLLPINIRNRFLEVQIGDFPVGELREVIEKRFNGLPEGDAMTPEVATQLEGFYFALKERKVGFTMREIIKVVRRFTMFDSKAENPPFWSHVALSLLRPQYHGSKEWKKVVEAAESVPGWENAVLPSDKEWPVSVDVVGSKVCFREGPLHLTLPDINLALSKHWQGGSVPPSAFLRKLVQLAFAISAGEPVLLSGPTSFKTELIRTWAAICGRTDHTVTLHITGETEAHDLLGHVNPMSFAELLKLLPALGKEVHARYALLHQEDGSGKSRLEEHLSMLLTSSLPNVLSHFADQVGKGVSSSECTEEEPSRDFLGGIELDSCSDNPSAHEGKASLLNGLLGDDMENSSQAASSNGWDTEVSDGGSSGGSGFDDGGFGEPAPKATGNEKEAKGRADSDDFDFCKMSAEDSGSSMGQNGDPFDDAGFDMPSFGSNAENSGTSAGQDEDSFEDAGFDMPADEGKRVESNGSMGLDGEDFDDAGFDMPGSLYEGVELDAESKDDAHGHGGLKSDDPFASMPQSPPNQPSFNIPDEVVAVMTEVIQLFDKIIPDNAEFGLQRLLERFKNVWAAIKRAPFSNDDPFFVFNDGPVARAVSMGQVLVIEDYDACLQSVTERLNSLLEPDPVFSLPEDVTASSSGSMKSSELIVPKESLQILATVHMDDSKRQMNLSAATKSRFTAISFPEYTVEELQQVLYLELKKRLECNKADSIATRIMHLRKLVLEDPRLSACSDVRQIFRWVDFICNQDADMPIDHRILLGAKFFYLDDLTSGAEQELVERWWKHFELDCNVLAIMDIEGKLSENDLPPFGVKLSEDGFVRAIELTCAGIGGKLMEPEPYLTDAKLHERLKCTATSTFMMNIARIFAAISAGSAPLLEGPPGIGKTAVVGQVASLLGAECVRINLSKDTSVQHLLGSIMPRFSRNRRVFEWHDGKLVEALKSRKWVLLDEINLAPPEVLEVLIPLLERRSGHFHVPGTDQVIPLDGLYIFATMNPASLGGGRSRLSRSFLSLFMVVHLEGHSDWELRAIMSSLFCEMVQRGYLKEQSLNDIFNLHVEIRGCVSRKEMGKSGGPYEFNLRDLTKVRDIVEGNIKNQMAHYQLAPQESDEGALGNEHLMDVSQIVLRRAVELVYKHRFSDCSDCQAAQDIIDKHLPRPAMEEGSASTVDSTIPGCVRIGSVYLAVKEDVFRDQNEGGLVHSSNTIKELEILAMGCQSKRTVLLQGDTCSKKTALVRELARLGGRQLLTISLHQNFETADLIGQWMPLTEKTFQVQLNQKANTLIDDISKHLLLYIIPVQNEQAKSSSIEALRKAYTLTSEAESGVSSGASQKELAKRGIDALGHLKVVLDTTCQDEGMDPEVRMLAAIMLKSLKYTLDHLEECVALGEDSIGFVFVESELVKALKLGHYILLDNINSAPPEVVERLNSLLEEDPVLVLYEHADGECLSRGGGGIDSDTRIFATADPKRPNTNKLSAAILNRMVSVQLPGMDVDLTPDNCTTHDLLPIVSAKFCDYPGGGIAASMLLQFHAGVKNMVEKREITPSNGLSVNFRSLQQASQVASHWMRKGKPVLSSTAWALWQTYTSGMQSGAAKLLELLAYVCEGLEGTPTSEFHRISSELGHMSSLERSSHEISVHMCSLEAMLIQVATKSLYFMKDASLCDGMADSEMCRAMLRLYPLEKASLELAFSEIGSARGMGKVMEVMDKHAALNPIDDSKIRELQKGMDYTSSRIQAGIIDFVRATSFLDYKDRSGFLKRIVWVAESFLTILRSTDFTNFRTKAVSVLLKDGISACNRVLHAKTSLQHFAWLELDVFVKTQRAFGDSLIDFEEAALYALNSELAKPIIDSKVTLPRILKKLMVVIQTDPIVVKSYQVVLQHIALGWENGLSVPFSLASEPDADPAFVSKMLKMEVAYCVVEAKKHLRPIVEGFVRLCTSGRRAKELQTRISTLESEIDRDRRPDEGPSSSETAGESKTDEVERLGDELKEEISRHEERANQLQASLQEALDSRNARFVLHCELLAAIHGHQEFLDEAHAVWKQEGGARGLDWDVTLTGRFCELVNSTGFAVHRSQLAALWIGMYFVKDLDFDRPKARIISVTQKCESVKLAKRGSSEVFFLVSDVDEGCYPLSLVVVERTRLRSGKIATSITHFCAGISEGQRSWVCDWIDAMPFKNDIEFMEKTLMCADEFGKPMSHLGQAAFSCIATIVQTLGGAPVDPQPLRDAMSEIHYAYKKVMTRKQGKHCAKEDDLSEVLRKLSTVQHFCIEDPMEARQQTDFFQKLESTFSLTALEEARRDLNAQVNLFKMRYTDAGENQTARLCWLSTALATVKESLGFHVVDMLERELPSSAMDVRAYRGCLDMMGYVLKVQQALMSYTLATLEENVEMYWSTLDDIVSFCESLLKDVLMVIEEGGDEGLRMISQISPAVFEERQEEFDKLVEMLRMPAQILGDNGLHMVMRKIAEIYKENRIDVNIGKSTESPKDESSKAASPPAEHDEVHELTEKYVALLKLAQGMKPVHMGLVKRILQKMAALQSLRDSPVSNLGLVKHRVDHANLRKSVEEYEDSLKSQDAFEANLNLEHKFSDTDITLTTQKLTVQRRGRKVTFHEMKQIHKGLDSLRALGEEVICGDLTKKQDGLLKYVSVSVQQAMWSQTISECIDLYNCRSDEPHDLSSWSGVLSIQLLVEIMNEAKNEKNEKMKKIVNSKSDWGGILTKILQEFSAWRVKMLVEDESSSSMICDHEGLKRLLDPLRNLKVDLSPNLVVMRNALRHLQGLQVALQSELNGCTGILKKPALMKPPELCLADPVALLFPCNSRAFAEHCELEKRISSQFSGDSSFVLELENVATGMSGLASYCYVDGEERVAVFDTSMEVPMCEAIGRSCEELKETILSDGFGLAALFPEAFIQVHSAVTLMSMVSITWRGCLGDSFERFMRLAKPLPQEEKVARHRKDMEALGKKISDQKEHIKKIKGERQDVEMELSEISGYGTRQSKFHHLNSKRERLIIEESDYSKELEQMLSKEDLLNGMLYGLEDECAQAKKITQQRAKNVIDDRMNSLFSIGMPFLGKLQEADELESDWGMSAREADLSLDKALDFYHVNVKGLVEGMADIESMVEEESTDSHRVAPMKMDEQFRSVVEACSEIDANDPFRKGALFIAGVFKMAATAATRASQHLKKVRMGIRGVKAGADNAKAVLESFHDLASQTRKLSNDLLSCCTTLMEITKEEKSREEFIEATKELLQVEKKGMASLDTRIYRYPGCRASLDFTRMFVLKFTWVHTRYLDLRQPMGSYVNELRTKLIDRGLELESDMDNEAVVNLVESMQDGLCSVAESLMCQAHHALFDYPSSPLQVVTAIDDATKATGDGFLPAAVYAEHAHKALVVLGENLTGSGVCLPEIEPLCGVFEAGTRVLGRKFQERAKASADGLQDVSILEDHLQHMVKELALHRPNLADFLNQVMMRFRALKGELVTGHLLQISQEFSASLGKTDPTCTMFAQGNEDMDEELQFPQIMYELTVAAAIDVQKFRAALRFYEVDDTIVRICHEIATLLKQGVPSVGEIIAGVVKGASDVFDAHTIVDWYQNASDAALEVLSGKVEKVLSHETDVLVVIPEIVQRLNDGVLMILDFGEGKVHSASIDRHLEELKDLQQGALMVGNAWDEQGEELISARQEKRKGIMSNFLHGVRERMKDFLSWNTKYEEQEGMKSHLWAQLEEILKLCRQIGEEGDSAFCNDQAHQLLHDQGWLIRQEPNFSLQRFGLERRPGTFTFRIRGVEQPRFLGWGFSKVAKLRVTCTEGDEVAGHHTVSVPPEGLDEVKIDHLFQMNSQPKVQVQVDFLKANGSSFGPSITKPLQVWRKYAKVAFGNRMPHGCLHYEIHVGYISPTHLGKKGSREEPRHDREAHHTNRGSGNRDQGERMDMDDNGDLLYQLKEMFKFKFRNFDSSSQEFSRLKPVSKPEMPESEETAESRERSKMSRKEAHDKTIFSSMAYTQRVKGCVECVSELVEDSEKLFNVASQVLSSEMGPHSVEELIGLTEGLSKVIERCKGCGGAARSPHLLVSLANPHEHHCMSMIWTEDMKKTFAHCQEAEKLSGALGARVLTEAFRLVLLGLMCKAFEMSSPADIKAFQNMKTNIQDLAKSISGVKLLDQGAIHNMKWIFDSMKSIAAFRENLVQTLVKIETIRGQFTTEIGSIDPECLSGCHVTELGQVLLVEDSGAISSAPSKLVVDFGTVLHIEEGDRSQSRQMVRTIRLVNKTSENIDFKFKSTCEETTPGFMIFPHQGGLLPNVTIDISCSLDLRQMGKLKGKWEIDYGHACPKGMLIVKAAVEKLRVDFDCEGIDFGHIAANSGPQKRKFKVRNSMGATLLIKSQVQEAPSCVWDIQPTRLMLGGYEEKVFELELDPGAFVGESSCDVIVGVNSSHNLKTISARVSIVKPSFRLLDQNEHPVGQFSSIKLPAAKSGEKLETWLKLENSGKVPVQFKFDSSAPGLNFIGGKSGDILPDRAGKVYISLEEKRGSREYPFELNVLGCGKQNFMLKGSWGVARLAVRPSKITIQIPQKKLPQRDGKIQLEKTVMISNDGVVGAKVLTPKGEAVEFEKDVVTVESKESAGVKMLLFVDPMCVWPATKSKLSLFTEAGESLPFELQFDMRGPCMEIKGSKTFVCREFFEAGETVGAEIDVSNIGESTLQMSSWGRSASGQDVRVECMHGKTKNDMQFAIYKGDARIRMKFKAPETPGWFKEHVTLSPINDFRAGFDCEGDHRKICILGYVGKPSQYLSLAMRNSKRTQLLPNWQQFGSLSLDIVYELVKSSEDTLPHLLLFAVLPYDLCDVEASKIAQLELLERLERFVPGDVSAAVDSLMNYMKKRGNCMLKHGDARKKLQPFLEKKISTPSHSTPFDIPAEVLKDSFQSVYCACLIASESDSNWMAACTCIVEIMPNRAIADKFQDAADHLWNKLVAEDQCSFTETVGMVQDTLDIVDTSSLDIVKACISCLDDGACSFPQLLQGLGNLEPQDDVVSTLLNVASGVDDGRVPTESLESTLLNPGSQKIVQALSSGHCGRMLLGLLRILEKQSTGNGSFKGILKAFCEALEIANGRSLLEAIGKLGFQTTKAKDLLRSSMEMYPTMSRCCVHAIDAVNEAVSQIIEKAQAKEGASKIWRAILETVRHFPKWHSASSLTSAQREQIGKIVLDFSTTESQRMVDIMKAATELKQDIGSNTIDGIIHGMVRVLWIALPDDLREEIGSPILDIAEILRNLIAKPPWSRFQTLLRVVRIALFMKGREEELASDDFTMHEPPDFKGVEFIARALVTIDGKSPELLDTVDTVSGILGSGAADESEGSSSRVKDGLICLSVNEEENEAIQQTTEAMRQSFRNNRWDLEESLLAGLCRERRQQVQKVHKILRAAQGAADTWNEANRLEGISFLQQLIHSIASLSKPHSPASRLHQSAALEVYWAYLGCMLSRGNSDLGWRASKMGLLLAMGKLYGGSDLHESKDMVIPFAPPQIREERSPEDDGSESDDYLPAEAEESGECWYPFPETSLVSDGEINRDCDDHDSDASSFADESSSYIKEKVEESIVQKLKEIERLADNSLDIVNQIPKKVEINAELPANILPALAEAKYAAEEWMSIFQQACQMISLGHKVVDPALQPTVVHLGIKLCMAMECFRMWMGNGHQGGQAEIRFTCGEILRLLSLIPGGNLNKDIQKAISMLQPGSATALHTNVDFQMPSQSRRRIREAENYDSTTPDYTPGQIESLGLSNSRRRSEQHHTQNLNSVMLSGDQGKGMCSGIALDSSKTSILKQSIMIDDVDFTDIFAGRGDDAASGEPGSSEISQPSPRNTPGPSENTSLSLAVYRAQAGNAKKARSRGAMDGPIDFSRGAEICAGIADDEEITEAMAKFKVNPRLTEEQLKKCDFLKMYKDKRVLRRDNAPTPIEDPLQMDLSDRHEKWTYQLLVESKPLMKYCRMVLNDFRSQQEQFYQKTSENHIFEWCLLVDNSGSMITKANQAAEALVLAIETLRRLECPFAIARFGGKKSQRMLKTFGQTFSNGLGQQILESFSYDEATHPASGFANVAAKVWPHPINENEKGIRHRVMLMMVDGLTQEKDPADYTEITKEREVDLVVLNLKDGMQESIMQDIERLWGSVASCYEVLDVEFVEELPILLAGLIIKQFDQMLKGATEPQERGGKIFQPPISPPTPAKKIDVGILNSVGRLSYSKGKEEGAGGIQQLSMFQVGDGSEEIPFLDQAKSLPRAEKDDSLVEVAIDKTHDFYSAVDSDEAFLGVMKEAQSKWGEAAGRVAGQIDSMVEALEECLPVNVYTRNKASERGTSLHLQGLIKAVTTKFNYKKYFSAKKSGGKRQYAVTIVVDISMSMGGHLAQCSVEALVMFVEGLLSMDIENFTVLLFGSSMYVVKLPDTPWDGASIAALLSNLRHDREYASLDADAIECALSLFQATNPKGPRKIFIISDGFGTSGVRLAQALERAEEELVEVLAIGVGFDKLFVPHCYNKWLTAVLPCAIPEALKMCQEQGSAQGSGLRLNMVDDCEDWSQFAPMAADARESMEDILQHQKSAFPDLLEQLRGERSVKLRAGNTPSAMTVDVCYVLDTTGSMGPWIEASKSQIKLITEGIAQKVNEQHPGIKIELRFSMVAYKDYGDAERIRVQQFTKDVPEFLGFLQGLTAGGGGDAPEDVLGALKAAASMGDWEGRVKFVILIADAPGHGRDCNGGLHDSYPDGDPEGLTVQLMMEELSSHKVELMFCRINGAVTAAMEAEFKKFYDDPKIGRELTATDIFNSSRVPDGTEAAEGNTMEKWISRFGEIVSGMVAHRIMLDHL